MAISRMPVTLSDFNSARYKSSVSKLRKLCPHSGAIPKLSAMRQAFARALGYGSENELRALAEGLGQYYTDSPLNISEVITSVSQRIARQWSVSIDSAESITLGLGLQHFDACRPVVRSNYQNNEIINSPATNESASDENPVVLPNSPLTEDKPPISIGQLDRLTRGSPIQAELDRLGAFGLGAAGLGSSPFKDWNESTGMRAIREMSESLAMKAIAEMNNSPTMRAAREVSESPAMKAITEMNNSPTMRAAREISESPAMKAIAEINSSPAMRAVREMSESPAIAILDRLNANPALAALDRFYAIPAVAARLSHTDADMEG